MKKIKLMNKISPAGLSKLDRNHYNVGEEVEAPAGILLRSASMHEMEFNPELQAIARAGAGVNNIPIDRCTEKGIVVFNTPGANANAVKELVMAGLLISARKVFPSMQWVQTLKGCEDVEKAVEKGKGQFGGPELRGKCLGVIGLGAIGIQVANMAKNFGMTVYGYDPYISIDAAWSLSRSVIHASSLEDIYRNCDFITLHVPMVAQTKGMINSESIKMMKHGVRILNFARAGLVVDEDIMNAMDESNVRCYVTDFPTESLLGHPGVLAIPHLGASTPESEDNCARMAAEQLDDFLTNGNIKNAVNLPNVSMSRSGEARVCCIHSNIPNMLAQIIQVISTCGINIENMTNKSRNDIAYTMLDISGDLDSEKIEKIKNIDGVIRINIYR